MPKRRITKTMTIYDLAVVIEDRALIPSDDSYVLAATIDAMGTDDIRALIKILTKYIGR